ncbi:kinase-like domain-containing protein [Blastocladiella britannica]|nr:kinase-like domain-containing protein [Blastocladiella britannica]
MSSPPITPPPPPRVIAGAPLLSPGPLSALSHPASWQVILLNEGARQVVLYNPASHALAVQSGPVAAAAAVVVARRRDRRSPGAGTMLVSTNSRRMDRNNATTNTGSVTDGSGGSGGATASSNGNGHSGDLHACPMCGRAFPFVQLLPLAVDDEINGDAMDQDDAMMVDPVSGDEENGDDADRMVTDDHDDDDVGSDNSSQTMVVVHPPSYLDRDYFHLLADVHHAHPPLAAEADRASTSPSSSSPHQHHNRGLLLSSNSDGDNADGPKPTSHHHLPDASFNDGYYARFFVECSRLGRGAHGAVYMARHVLDTTPLGEYAIKKVAVGDDAPWLAQQLREVSLLARLRHPNIVAYKHAWLEHAKPSPFSPVVPCLFILMDRANGGNLEDWLAPSWPSDSADGSSRAKAIRAQRLARAAAGKLPSVVDGSAWRLIGRDGGWARAGTGDADVVRVLSTEALLNMAYGVARGLEHLHRLGVVHRDLKPPNILLEWELDVDGRPSIPNDTHDLPFSPPTNQIPTVVLSDFGECEELGSMSNAPSIRVRTGATGTLDFTAPEQLARDAITGNLLSARYAPSADVWSLGLILLYLAYGGHVPFLNRDDVDLLRDEILASSIDNLLRVTRSVSATLATEPRVPATFHAIVARCLHRDPARRPTASQVALALMRVRDAECPRVRLGEEESDVGIASGETIPYSVSTSRPHKPRVRARTVDSSAPPTFMTVDDDVNAPMTEQTTMTVAAASMPSSGEAMDVDPPSPVLRVRRRARSALTSDRPPSMTMSAVAPLLLPDVPLIPRHTRRIDGRWQQVARFVQVASLAAVPAHVPTPVAVCWTCAAMAVTEFATSWVMTATPAAAGGDSSARRLHTSVAAVGGIAVHLAALAGMSWAWS